MTGEKEKKNPPKEKSAKPKTLKEVLEENRAMLSLLPEERRHLEPDRPRKI